ncbi:MAG: 16S rRNA (cytosine(967)-C(5))-methyltransferase RsmB, partial [Candidatus Marinimicrobia bacterium]|nr:16S rRNA (cytosine(967)-C(5))-methyltransferase RsmB [Candidatus Neomarinimicrobiota bacterium]
PKGQIHAYEIDPGRIDMINQTLGRLGLRNVQLYPGDALKQQLPAADKILIDVPCTGTGVMGRRADLRWKRKPEHLEELGSLQQQLLEHAVSALAHSALLIYATCSIEPEENWDAVGAFLQRHPEVTVAPLPDHLPAHWIDADGALSTFPPSHQVDGVFAVRLSQ